MNSPFGSGEVVAASQIVRDRPKQPIRPDQVDAEQEDDIGQRGEWQAFETARNHHEGQEGEEMQERNAQHVSVVTEFHRLRSRRSPIGTVAGSAGL